jgi:cytochrome c oxidase assembly factor CtaG
MLMHVHAGDVVTRDTLWTSWPLEPGVVVSLIAIAAGYAAAVSGARRDGAARAITQRMIACFTGGWIALAAALLSPIDPLGETLFAAHMVQHLILIVVAAPLLIIGAPPAIWLWMFRAPRRRRIGIWLARSTVVRATENALGSPAVVIVAHVAALWFWHFPRPYHAALENPAVHAAEHLSFTATSMLFWWVVLKPMGRRGLGYGPAILAIGLVLCTSGALGALLMFSSPWYSSHAAGETAWGISAIEDQQLAGLLMWIPASAVYVGAAAALFTRWMASEERHARQVDRALAFNRGEA